MASITIQEKIDEYKEQLPDQLYIELCDLTMKENKQEQKEQDFYEVKYVIPCHFHDDDGDNNISVEFKKEIVKLEKKIYNKVIEEINSRGVCCHQVNIRIDDGCYDNYQIIKQKNKQIYNNSSGCNDDNKFFNIFVRPKIISIKKA